MNRQIVFLGPDFRVPSTRRFWTIIPGRPLAFLALILIPLVLFCPSGLTAGHPDQVVGRILVKGRPGIAEPALLAVFAAQGAQQERAIEQIGVRILRVPDWRFDRTLTGLKQNRNLEFAEPDYLVEPALVPNDTYYPFEWHLPKIQAPEAWNTTTGSGSVIIAILDSGIDAAHPDLAGLVVPGWNLFDNNADTSDITGHGTAVAGQACALGNNSLGIAAPAWACKLMPLRVADANGYTTYSLIASGLVYAADHGARVANASFAIVGTSSTLSSAAQYFQSKGGVFTGAAGNDAAFDSSPDDPYVLRVSATDASDVIASFSNTGNNIDICAPGVSMLTTTKGGGFGTGTGTSASAPVVAAVAALVISANPSLSGSEVQALLKQSTDDLGALGWDPTYGWGRINAYKAVQAAVSVVQADTIAPTAQVLSPTPGSVVSGTAAINISASDNVAVNHVDLCLNGTVVASSTTASATFSWDTTQYGNGSYSIQAKAYDGAGNVGTSSSVAVTVQNAVVDKTPPAVQITNPTAGTRITSKTTAVSVVAADNVAVARVDLLVDGKKYASSTSPTPTFSWNTSKVRTGSHTLQSVAYDGAGNSSRSSVVSVIK